MVNRAGGPRVSERVEQAHIVRLLRTVGGTVYVIGTTRKRGDHPGTMQTPGLADLLVFLPDRSHPRVGALRALWIEVKATDGRLSPVQKEFRACCQLAELDYVSGPLDAVIAWLVSEGYLKDSQIPYYRQPAPAVGKRKCPSCGEMCAHPWCGNCERVLPPIKETA